MNDTGQTKSKKRIRDFGEVFTPEHIVKSMCDLVKQETERIESRFLEPACGNGNFLAEVTNRKLMVVQDRYGKSAYDYERYAVLAMASIYGIDLLMDNVDECRNRLFFIWDKSYSAICKHEASDQCRKAVKYILQKNIICGDALTLKQINGEPIIFAEWSLVTGSKIKRRDFALDELLNGHNEQMSIDMIDWEYDEEIQAFIPSPIREYPLVDYREVHMYGGDQ